MSRALLVVNGVLAGVCLVCLALIVAAWTAPRPRPAAMPSDGSTLSGAPPSRPALRTPDRDASVQGIANRNLFSPSRSETASRDAKAAPLARPNLYGVVIGDENSIAYLQDPVSKRVFGHRVGDAIAGAVVTAISADGVVLSSRNGTITIGMQHLSPPPPVLADADAQHPPVVTPPSRVATPNDGRPGFAPAIAVTAAAGTDSEESEPPTASRW